MNPRSTRLLQRGTSGVGPAHEGSLLPVPLGTRLGFLGPFILFNVVLLGTQAMRTPCYLSPIAAAWGSSAHSSATKRHFWS